MQKLLTWFHRLEDGLLVAVLFLMIGLAVLEVVLRNFFGESLVWIEPVMQNAVLWVALLGTMVGSRRDEQIRIDIASHYLPVVLQRWLSVALDLVTAAVCLIVAYYSASFVFTDEIHNGGNAFAGMPSWVLETIIPVGFTVIGLRYILLFVLNLLGRRPHFDTHSDTNDREHA
jgi:TRAP-type C4-dicarboxylate transport system permease small subunit